MNLTKIGLGIAGLITFIIDTALGGDADDAGDGDADKPQRDGKGGPKKGNVEEEEGDNGAEEGGGQFDSFSRSIRYCIYLFHLVQRFVALPIDLDIIMHVGCHDFKD